MIQLIPKGTNGALLTGHVLYKPDNFDETKKYPCMIFLHGIGEKGNGASELTAVHSFVSAVLAAGAAKEGFIVVAPQLPRDEGNWNNKYVDEALHLANVLFSADQTKTSLHGISLGGGGVWTYASASVANAKKFCAIVAVCGVGGWSNLKNIADSGVPVWAFHAADDGGNTPASVTHQAIDGINAFNPAIPAKKTIYPTGGHTIWSKVYDAAITPGNQNELETVWQWAKRNSVGAPVAVRQILSTGVLVANAGPDKTTTRGGEAILDGSGSIGATFTWVKAKGPSCSSRNGWNNPTLHLYNLAEGEYEFELQVKDSAGALKTDRAKVYVGNVGDPPPLEPPTKTVKQVITLYTDGTYESK